MQIKFLPVIIFISWLLTAAVPNRAAYTNSSVSKKSIFGLWISSYSADNVPGAKNLFYSIAIYPDGSMLTKGKGADNNYYYSSGTWKLSANHFSATVISFVSPALPQPVTQKMTAIFTAKGTLINGKWHDTVNPNGPGNKGSFTTFNKVK